MAECFLVLLEVGTIVNKFTVLLRALYAKKNSFMFWLTI